MNCNLPGSSFHGILQARILEWVAMPSSRGSFWPRDWTHVFCIAGRFFTQLSHPGSTDFLPILTLFALSASVALISRLILKPLGKQDSLPASPVTSSQPEPPRGSLTLHQASTRLPLSQWDDILSFPRKPFPLPRHCFLTAYLLLSYLTDHLNPDLSILEIQRASKQGLS